jgi:hypothetical protein
MVEVNFSPIYKQEYPPVAGYYFVKNNNYTTIGRWNTCDLDVDGTRYYNIRHKPDRFTGGAWLFGPKIIFPKEPGLRPSSQGSDRPEQETKCDSELSDIPNSIQPFLHFSFHT